MKGMVTVKEIAKQLRVSISTVSRALQDNPRISLPTRRAVQTLARQLNYSPSATALNLRSGKSGLIGVVLPEIREHFFSEVVNGIESVILDKKYLVALYQSHDSFDLEKQILSALATNRIEGLLLSVAKESKTFQHIQNVIDWGIPVVLLDRIPPEVKTHQVGCDIKKGAYESTKWLAQNGYRRIALLNGPSTLAASDERYEGYITALQETHLPIEGALIKRSDLTQVGTTEKMNQLLALPSRPDAVLAFNDYVALDAMRVCRNHGVYINQEISFVSFANLPLNMYLEEPPLVSVEQHPFKIGQRAAEILVGAIKGYRETHTAEYERVILKPELIVWKDQKKVNV